MSVANRAIVAILIVAALAVGFWMLLLAPKREEADKLSGEVDSLNVTLAEARNRATEAEAAEQEFPADYRQLVVLGQAVPASDETASLIVELDEVATDTKIGFESLKLASGGGETVPVEAAPAPPPAEATAPESSSAVPAAATVPPTEAAASLLPLGATIGPAGLAVMPYDLTFSGDFFEVADFIAKIDSLVHTGEARVAVEGRLVTIDGFSLAPISDEASVGSDLNATFSVTTYVIPPGQGVTAGASPTAPAPESPAPAAEESAGTSETSETVSAR